MKLFQLLEMPMINAVIGSMTELHFGKNDEKVTRRLLSTGKYHLAFQHFPFDFYLFVGENLMSQAERLRYEQPKAVIFVCRENLSPDEHMPPTPWMIIHRFIQDGLNSQNRPFVPYEIGNLVQLISDELYSVSDQSGYRDKSDFTNDAYDLLEKVLQMRSVRDKRMVNIEEIEIEAITEILITGHLRMEFGSVSETEETILRQVRNSFVQSITSHLYKVDPGVYVLSQ